VDKECLIVVIIICSGWLWCVDDYKSEWAMWSDPETWAWGDWGSTTRTRLTEPYRECERAITFAMSCSLNSFNHLINVVFSSQSHTTSPSTFTFTLFFAARWYTLKINNPKNILLFLFKSFISKRLCILSIL